MSRISNIEELTGLYKTLEEKYLKKERYVSVCSDTACRAMGAMEVFEALKKEIESHGLEIELRIKDELVKDTGCHGFCGQGPVVVIHPEKIFYRKVKPSDAKNIVEQTLLKHEVVTKLLYKNPDTNEDIIHEEEIPFYKRQTRLLMNMNNKINPINIEDYIAIGGYQALAKALSKMQPDEIIEEMKASGLRGRGGAGFPTGWKWEDAKKHNSDIKYLICNADEGDPGAYMDRSLLEGNPHSVLEGMIIGAYAVGAPKGFIYVRREYPLALENAAIAIQNAKKLGLLGKNILGKDFSFDITIARGGGAFVAGESSALMLSIEGKPAEPRSKYIHATESGLYEKPTVLNNVETWANVPIIINKGGKWYASIGTENSKGTKIFSLVGDVVNTGLVEVPMGMKLRQVIFDIGGGISKGKKFKGVQTGGPSGGVLPETLLDMPVDYDSLTEAGSMMGSGGMIVMGDSTCMVDVAKYYVNFLKGESCGKCTPCREGLRQMHNILDRITKGTGTFEDVTLMEELAPVVATASLCGLGKSAPNPVLTTLKYFREEYEEHVKEKKCRAGVCKAIIHYEIIPELCKGCLLCLKRCPSGAVVGKKKEIHKIIQEKCIKCGVCMDVCNLDAVKVI